MYYVVKYTTQTPRDAFLRAFRRVFALSSFSRLRETRVFVFAVKVRFVRVFISLGREDARGAHPAADAHGHHAGLFPRPPHLVQQRGDAPRAGRAERVT